MSIYTRDDDDNGDHDGTGPEHNRDAEERQTPPEADADASGDTEPARDARGRYLKGGNSRGRPPRNKRPKPASMEEAFAEALQRPIGIMENGKRKTVNVFEALALKMVNSAMSGNLLDAIRLLRALKSMNALSALKDAEDAKLQAATEANGGAWTPELEDRYQAIMGEFLAEEAAAADHQAHLCPKCRGPQA